MGASSGMGELADNGRALGARHGRLRLAGSHSIVCKNKPVDIVFEAAAKVKGGDRFDGEFGESKIPVFLAAENLKPFISNELVENSRPVFFRPVKGPGKLIGFRAELIPQVCHVLHGCQGSEAPDAVDTTVPARVLP
jgi:hypothetical protein